jgi:hypothetical protein
MTTKPLTSNERAELELLRDTVKQLIVFDGGAELLSHQQMHRHHKSEPYIGCVFCRDKFMLVSEHETEVAQLREALRTEGETC